MAKSTREAYGEALAELGKTNERIVVMDADLSGSTKTSTFKKAFPDRFYDFGIAEANMIDAAAGFAFSGYIPFASTFAMFGAGRAYEQIRNSVAYAKANVKLAFTHAGLSVGEDGGSHQALEDISLMRGIPGMTVFVPCDAEEAKKAVAAAVEIDGPVYLRLSRPNTDAVTDADTPFIPGKANVIRDGSDAAIFATGLMVTRAIKAAELLEAEGISAAVVNFHTIKPLDKELIVKAARETGRIVTVEEHNIIGGLGEAVSAAVCEECPVPVTRIGVNDVFGHSGPAVDLLKEFGLSSDHIVEVVTGLLKK